MWLIADPAAGLGAKRTRQLLRSLLSAGGTGTVIVSQPGLSALEVFDRVLHMRDGRIVFDGTPAEWNSIMSDGPKVVSHES